MMKSVLAVTLFFWAALCGGGAARGVDIPAPTLTTFPAPPPANQPFEATFHAYLNPSMLGFDNFFGDNVVRVEGKTITLLFEAECGFLCPGGGGYVGFPVAMPALPADVYHVRVVAYAEEDYVFGEFDLAVGAVGNVPASSTLAELALTAGLAIGGVLFLSRRRRTTLL